MKINEKFLMAYANAPYGIEKEGFLQKKGELHRSYQRRWFVLKGNLLFYFEKQTDKQPVGVIILEDCNVDVCDADRYSFTLSFFGDRSRIYVLCAESEEDMISWMKKITIAPYSYTQMVVNELEKKVERLKNEEKKKKAEKESEELVGAVANIDLDVDEWGMEVLKKISSKEKKISKPKGSLDRNTIGGHPKSFHNLLTVVGAKNAIKNNLIPGIRRTKSSENMNKIVKSPSASPVAPRRKMYQSVMRKKTQVKIVDIELLKSSEPLKSTAKPLKKETFVLLHHRYTASIWNTVKEYENEPNQDLMEF